MVINGDITSRCSGGIKVIVRRRRLLAAAQLGVMPLSPWCRRNRRLICWIVSHIDKPIGISLSCRYQTLLSRTGVQQKVEVAMC